VSILYYAAKNASNYYALWSTNGSASATFDVLTATQTFGSTSPYGFTTLGDDVIFAAQEATTYFAVWVSGGTSATTFELLSSQQGGYTLSPQDFVGVGGEALFEGRDSDNREAVFATAGVSGDPSVLLEFNKPLTRLQGFGAFAIASEASPAGGAEIWFTNGTTALTSLLYSQARQAIGVVALEHDVVSNRDKIGRRERDAVGILIDLGRRAAHDSPQALAPV
jgi:hypothetical protein